LHAEPNPQLDASVVSQVLESSLTQAGKSIVELSAEAPVLLVFLRHAGCSFCRETLADIASSKAIIEGRGMRIILVHMGEARALNKLLAKNQLSGLDLICDADRRLYDVFGLKRGTLRQLLGWKVLWRGVFGGVLLRHGIGPVRADASQLAGAFLIDHCAIVRRFRHGSAADRPDYVSLCTSSDA
jgi:peroxiredoxin